MAPFLLLAFAATAFAQKQSSTPPRDLHRAGDHWTAYNPPDPATYPAGAKTHTIKSGDTLWALAQTYYGNAYLWPQLWESNTWVTDAHWIYPGDVLLVEGEGNAAPATASVTNSTTTMTAETSSMQATATTAPATANAGEADEGFASEEVEGGIPVARIARDSRPIPLATESDIYCYGYIGDPNESLPNYFESIEDTETGYLPHAPGTTDAAAFVAQGDLIYIHGGSATGLVAGETYLAVTPGDLVYHPVTGKLLGRQYQYAGQVRVLCTEPNRSRAVISQSCREIDIGARLKPLPQLPIPIARIPESAAWCDAPTGRTVGTIVHSLGWDVGMVQGNLIQIDLGAEDQLQPGDFMTVYRPSPRADQPRVVLGEIGILTTQAHSATAIIVQSRRDMQIGDQVEMR
ncbi:MAG: LysM peptidoglycan-binding domain-containing protein [Acidobacteria bacterium]|nr:LysM peptidoglycan-binding domain-containing protein [Acidobacteriota bacterium]MBV9478212.1 LysM peptidoglycan-binding domain-containing protein [Acidobacteriota bacterium]